MKYEDTPTLVYGLMKMWSKSRRSELWAVNDLDLDIEPGEAVGIIGRNGSGKSTLLQMLCGVTAPTTGEVRVAGRIAPLISVGVGFHPELTGRENVYVNGTILGLTRRQIGARLDEIVAFSEIEAFIDTPVKFYSSGMFVRLGFSVAANVDPDVLLIDEVLAVGDFPFQRKCFQHMERMQRNGSTIILVSHSAPTIERICNRTLVMSQGRRIFDGPVTEGLSAYYEAAEQGDAGEVRRPGDRGLAFEGDVLEVLSHELVAEDGTVRSDFKAGEMLRIRVQVRALAPVTSPFMSVELLSEQGLSVYSEHNLFAPFDALESGQQAFLEASCRLNITTGGYTALIVVARGNQASREPDLVRNDVAQLATQRRATFYVTGRVGIHGLIDLQAAFSSSRPGPARSGSVGSFRSTN